jgi:hypothetical protein
MTTRTLNQQARGSTLPTFHVGRPLALLRGLAVTLICLALAVGFVAQVWRGTAGGEQGRGSEVAARSALGLAAFDQRRGWAELGHASLWYFLHRDLGLSKGAASHRKVAAGLVQRFPGVEAPLRDGRLCLSSVVELSHVLTAENAAE